MSVQHPASGDGSSDGSSSATSTPVNGVTSVDPRSWLKPRDLRKCLSFEDFERAARRYLPKPLFGFVSGGVEGEISLRHNRAVFDDYQFVSRILRDVTARTLDTPLFGKSYAAPIGIAPMGTSALMAYRGDNVLASGAHRGNIPMIVSGGAITSLEEIRQHHPDAWFQAYFEPKSDRIAALVDRVAAAGYQTLVVTVDVPVPGNRENNVRNGFSTPIRPTLRLAAQGITHPRWLVETAIQTIVRHGMPHFENAGAERGVPVFSRHATRLFSGRDAMSWALLEEVRKRWKGNLVIKGILNPDDARIAVNSGVDGIIVSNHGGRQLDALVSPLRVLPAIVAAAEGRPVMIDSGFRRGTDILKAIALGAKMVFIGRPFLYAAAIGGEAGVRHLTDLLKVEISRDLALLGAMSPAELHETRQLKLRGELI